jgi:hypothetical protein
VRPSRGRLALLSLSACACIIPDRDIQIDPGIDNVSAVRIVERAPDLPEMDELCNVDDLQKAELEYCPEVRKTLPSGLVRPSAGEFCVCPAGPRSDRRAVPNFLIYAEDGDRERDRPKDTLYGVALLDPDLAQDSPNNAVAYENYWEAGRAGEVQAVNHDDDNDRTAAPVGRRVLNLWAFPFGNSSGSSTAETFHVDLCNDDNGEALTPGLHNLRFMVTDRPFFRPLALIDGSPVKTSNGKPAYDPTQFGVPDLAAGATYAVIDYVFDCVDANDPDVKAHDDEQRMRQDAIDNLDPDTPLKDPLPEPEPLICDCKDPEPQ